MPELFGIDIAGIIADTMGDGLLEVATKRYVAGARQGRLSAGLARSPVNGTGRGMWQEYSAASLDDQNILLGDRRALLLGGTLSDPVQLQYNDEIAIEGETRFVVRLEARDPAAATWTYQTRDRRGPDGQ